MCGGVLQLAIAQKTQGNLYEAKRSYKQAIFLKSDYAEAYNNLGVIFEIDGSLDEAINSYSKALHLINPDYAIARHKPNFINRPIYVIGRQSKMIERI